MLAKDLGFVLRRYNFRETSVIVHLYTLSFGRITGILKGFYTNKKEFSSPLDIFSLNELIFYPKQSSIWLVSFVDLVESFSFLNTDFAKSNVAGVLIQLVQNTMPLWEKNVQVFHLIKNCLQALEEYPYRRIFYIFLVKFLTLSGFKPELNRCLVCHCDLVGHVYFSASKGGLVCSNCSKRFSDRKMISQEASSCLRYIQDQELTSIYRLIPSLRCEQEILFVLKEFLLYHLEFDIMRYAANAISGIIK